MRLNEDTAIVGDEVVLVPYRKEHVKKYHEWMKDPALLEATASEPLSLEEEYEMQQKWHLDDDKLTFIVLARPRGTAAASAANEEFDIEACQMIGDVNLFMPGGPQGEDVECEIMIAEQSYRGRGLAKESLSLLLHYATSPSTLLAVRPSSLIARIGTSNVGSIRLFESLGFGKVKVVQVFQEVEMRFGWRDGGAGHVDKEKYWGKAGDVQSYHAK